MTPSVGITLLSVFKEPLLKASKDLKDEFLQMYDNGLAEYIDNFYDKFSKTKTFIYRDEKVNFSDIFFPVGIKNSFRDFNSNNDLDKLFQNNYITIIGSAGSGKSMLMKHIFLSTISRSYRIPIVVELRNLNEFEGTLFDYVENILSRNKLGKNSKIVDRILKQGKFLFLLDGYDEIYSSAKNRITIDIEEFVDTYSKNIFVITSRPGSNAESLQRFDNFYVKSLNRTEIELFIKQQFKSHENHQSVDRIINVIDKPENKDYQEYLSNPLLLSMFIFTFNSYPELPKYKNKFYWNVFDTLCTKHDSFTKKGFWLHERKSNLLNDDFENILKWFSYATIFKGKYNFDYITFKKHLSEILAKLNLACNVDDLIYDLTVSISIIIQDGIDFTFPHKSLQEYFTASLIKGLNDLQKQKVYSKKFDQLEKNSTGGKINLYKLCHEMDKVSFSKLFLLPQTEKFLINIDNSSKLKIIGSYINFFSMEFFIFDRNDINLSAYSQDFYVEDSYLGFFTDKILFSSFTEINKHIKILIPLFQVNKKSKILSLKLNSIIDTPEFKNFMTKTEWGNEIYFLHNEILNNYRLLKEEVEKESQDTDELLDV